jgi:hypothetical protein
VRLVAGATFDRHVVRDECQASNEAAWEVAAR